MPKAQPPNAAELLGRFPYRTLRRQLQQLLGERGALPELEQFAMQIFANYELLEDRAFVTAFAQLIQDFYGIGPAAAGRAIAQVSPSSEKFFRNLDESEASAAPEAPQQEAPKPDAPAPARRGRKPKPKPVSEDSNSTPPAEKPAPEKPRRGPRAKKEPEAKTQPPPRPAQTQRQLNPRLVLWQERPEQYVKAALRLDALSYKEIVAGVIQQTECAPVCPLVESAEPLSLHAFPAYHQDFQTPAVKWAPPPRFARLSWRENALFCAEDLDAGAVVCPAVAAYVPPCVALSTLLTLASRRQLAEAELAAFVNAFLSKCFFVQLGDAPADAVVLDTSGMKSVLSLAAVGEPGNVELVQGQYLGAFCLHLAACAPVKAGDALVLSPAWRWQTEQAGPDFRLQDVRRLVRGAEELQLEIHVPSASEKYHYRGFCQNKVTATALEAPLRKMQAKLFDQLQVQKEDACHKLLLDHTWDGRQFQKTSSSADNQDDEESRGKKQEQLENELRNCLHAFFDAVNEAQGAVFQEDAGQLRFADLLGW